MPKEREDVETKSSDSPEIYQQTRFMECFEKTFPWLLCVGAAFGLILMIFIPNAVFQEKSGVQLKAQSDLRLAILYTTGGMIAALGLLETYRKNTNDRTKANADINAALENQKHQTKVLEEQIRQFDKNAFKERKAERRERYTKAVEQLGDEKPSIRLGGVYTLVGLVDEWLEEESIEKYEDRLKEGQVIINNLCAYIRSPFTLATRYNELDKDNPTSDGVYKDNRQEVYTDKAEFKAEADVRLGIIKEIHNRLQGPEINTPGAWSDFEYDFSGSIFFYPVDLTNSYYTKSVNFSGSHYYKKVDFSGSTYEKDATFSNSNFRSTYKGWADFSGSIYEGEANFSNSAYEKGVIFSKCNSKSHYKKRVDFSESTYCNYAIFKHSTYNASAIFTDSIYMNEANFANSKYEPHNKNNSEIIDFSLSIYINTVSFEESTYNINVIFYSSLYYKEVYFGPSVNYEHLSLGESIYYRSVYFNGSCFYKGCMMTNSFFGSCNNNFTYKSKIGDLLDMKYTNPPHTCRFLTQKQKEYLKDKFQEIEKINNKFLKTKDCEEKARLSDTLRSLYKELHEWRKKATTVNVEGRAPEEDDN